MAQVAEKNLVTLLAYDLIFLEAGEALHSLIERGDPPLYINGENTNAQIFQKLAELPVQNTGLGQERFFRHGA
jgi:hypothetical protein